MASFLQELIDIGVAGFRFDAAQHMWPEDIKNIIDKVDAAFYYHEVDAQEWEAITVQEYYDVGMVTEFRYGRIVGDAVKYRHYDFLKEVYLEVNYMK